MAVLLQEQVLNKHEYDPHRIISYSIQCVSMSSRV